MKRRNIICVMRKFKGGSIGDNNGEVFRDEDDKIWLRWIPKGERLAESIGGLSTHDARLLAKRINQFLDHGG